MSKRAARSDGLLAIRFRVSGMGLYSPARCDKGIIGRRNERLSEKSVELDRREEHEREADRGADA